MQVNSTEFQATYATIQQQNMTYDNSGNKEPHTYTYAADLLEGSSEDS